MKKQTIFILTMLMLFASCKSKKQEYLTDKGKSFYYYERAHKLMYGNGKPGMDEMDYTEIIKCLNAALELYPECESCLMELASMYRISQDYDNLEAAYRKMMAIDTLFRINKGEYYYLIGRSKDCRGDRDSALYYYNKSLKHRLTLTLSEQDMAEKEKKALIKYLITGDKYKVINELYSELDTADLSQSSKENILDFAAYIEVHAKDVCN